MATETEICTFAHQLVDRMSTERLRALLELLDEEFFTDEEITEIRELRHSEEWSDWREARNDL